MQTDPVAAESRSLLRRDEGGPIIQDNALLTRGAIHSDVVRLQEVLSPFRARRIALTTQRADRIVVALLASQSLGCDLLLLRDHYGRDHPIWKSCQVSALLNDGLSVECTYPWIARDCGSRVLVTTSGTTGQPKIAVHSVPALLGRIVDLKVESARWLLTFHPASFAGLQVLLTAWVSASELVGTSAPTVANLAELLQKYQPTHVSGTPTFWRGVLLVLGDRSREIPVKQITIGGEAVDQATLDILHNAFPASRITHIYASTEAGALFAVKDGRAGFPANWLDQDIEGIGLRIREGVLEVKSPRTMERYLSNPLAHVRTEDGWIITGDLVEKRGDRVIFRGRADDVINVGGAKVNPEEVEAVLLKMPIVKEVRVFGQPNPMIGAVVTAEVVLPLGADRDQAQRAIYSFAAEHLENFKIPRIVKFVPEISTNSAGKKTRQP